MNVEDTGRSNFSINVSLYKWSQELTCKETKIFKSGAFLLGHGGNIYLIDYDKMIPVETYCLFEHKDSYGNWTKRILVCQDALPKPQITFRLPEEAFVTLTMISIFCLMFSISAEVFLPSNEMTSIHRLILLCLMSSLLLFYITWTVYYYIPLPQEKTFCKTLCKYRDSFSKRKKIH